MHTDIQTYRHTGIQIQTYRHTDIQTYRHTDLHTSVGALVMSGAISPTKVSLPP